MNSMINVHYDFLSFYFSFIFKGTKPHFPRLHVNLYMIEPPACSTKNIDFYPVFFPCFHYRTQTRIAHKGIWLSVCCLLARKEIAKQRAPWYSPNSKWSRAIRISCMFKHLAKCPRRPGSYLIPQIKCNLPTTDHKVMFKRDGLTLHRWTLWVFYCGKRSIR